MAVALPLVPAVSLALALALALAPALAPAPAPAPAPACAAPALPCPALRCASSCLLARAGEMPHLSPPCPGHSARSAALPISAGVARTLRSSPCASGRNVRRATGTGLVFRPLVAWGWAWARV
ncbi:hypothetical protein DEJ27_07295 [Curtobacterium sp. MCPF17_018]|nr:hypothetical protein DEJ27_07295 [Curtobacterium sp. MCPF17_018]